VKPRILLVDDDRAFRVSTAALLEAYFEIVEAEDGAAAVEALGRSTFDLMMLDLRMPGIQGIDLVEVLRARGEGVPILMISGYGTVDTAVRALHVGADDFLTKPVEPEELISRARRLIEDRPRLEAEPRATRLLGRSAGIRAVIDDIGRVASSSTTVLITGETGTGKELVARSVHEASPRASKPFVAINSAGLSEGILESQLFGHVRGAFTGADRDAEGLFTAADGGTIFLDEVGDVSPSAQKRLLRVLQEGEVLPVGAVKPHLVDVRVIAATHQDLAESVQANDFREDLYYRLNVFGVHLPPLRDRAEDLPLLVEHFLRSIGVSPGPAVSPLAMRRLLQHAWPGNIRQLFSALESARIRSEGETIHIHHLPPEIRGDESNKVMRYDGRDSAHDERAAVEAALEQAGGAKAEAARLLGMSRTTLWRKLRDLGME
jgi:DNA-binding NtrC family response regulator